MRTGEVPEDPLLDQVVSDHYSRVVSKREGHRKHDPTCIGNLGRFDSGCEVIRERLLNYDVFAGTGSVHSERRVKVMRHSEYYCVHSWVTEHLLSRARLFCIERMGNFFR